MAMRDGAHGHALTLRYDGPASRVTWRICTMQPAADSDRRRASGGEAGGAFARDSRIGIGAASRFAGAGVRRPAVTTSTAWRARPLQS